MSLDLVLIRRFEAVARLGSFSAAADEVGVTHSAMTKSIRTLEELWGVRLFERTTRSVVATAAGRRLGLPASPEEACQQLSGPANRRLVWLRTDPEGPNTEAFLRGCLEHSGQGWQDRSADLGLRSGEMRLFERSPQPMPSRAMSSTSAIERI